jgi:hypothetical protein
MFVESVSHRFDEQIFHNPRRFVPPSVKEAKDDLDELGQGFARHLCGCNGSDEFLLTAFNRSPEQLRTT